LVLQRAGRPARFLGFWVKNGKIARGPQLGIEDLQGARDKSSLGGEREKQEALVKERCARNWERPSEELLYNNADDADGHSACIHELTDSDTNERSRRSISM